MDVAVRNCLNFQRGVITRHTRLTAAKDDFERRRRERASIVPAADKGGTEGEETAFRESPFMTFAQGEGVENGSVLESNSTD